MVKILLVEDDKDYRETLAEILRMNNYDVVEAENGEEGYGLAIIENPDIIISDLEMPKVSGIEFIVKLRQIEEKNKKTPVIILSAYLDEGVILATKKLAISYYFDKPFEVKNLLNSIHKLTSLESKSSNCVR